MPDYSKLINTDLLERYDSNKSDREDDLIKSQYIKDKSEQLAKMFLMNRDGKIYGIKFPKDANGVIQASGGVKYGANNGLVVEPSTRTVAGRDDYANINVFRSIDANVHMSDDGHVIVDAIEGDPEFSYYGKVDVVCIFAPVYEKVYTETVSGTEWLCIEWCDTPRDGFTLNILCKNPDGTNRGWYCITKFQSGLIDGVPYASADIRPWTNGSSHNTCLTTYHNKSDYACAMTLSQLTIIQRIFLMKYSHTNFDTKLGGLMYYYYQGYALLTNATNVNYLVIDSTEAGNLTLNTRLDIGTSASRGTSTYNIFCNTELLDKDSNVLLFSDIATNLSITNTDYTITTQDFTDLLCVKPTTSGNDAEIINCPEGKIKLTYNGDTVEFTPVIVIDGANYAIYLYDENTNEVAHTANANAACTILTISDNVTATTSHYVATAIYKSGYSLEILGKDGLYAIGEFPNNNNRYRFPSVMSGIELFVGCYEVIGNAVFSYNADESVHILVQNDVTDLTANTTTIASNYADSGRITYATKTDSWKYGGSVTYDLNKGALSISDGGSSSNGLCDAQYTLGTKTSGFYEVLAFGNLYNSSYAGPFCLNAYTGLSAAHWSLGSRVAFGVALPATS